MVNFLLVDGTTTDGELAHVAALELALLDPRVRRGPDLVEALLDPDFREVGASGRVYDVDGLVEVLEEEQAARDAGRSGLGPVASAEGLEAVRLGPDACLVTYVSRPATGGAPSHRTSVWRRDATGAWQLLRHQGTRTAG